MGIKINKADVTKLTQNNWIILKSLKSQCWNIIAFILLAKIKLYSSDSTKKNVWLDFIANALKNK
jgi:hypothetical protein